MELFFLQHHFTPNIWEKPRADDTKKLKWNAVPTIFGEVVYQFTHTKGLLSL